MNVVKNESCSCTYKKLNTRLERVIIKSSGLLHKQSMYNTLFIIRKQHDLNTINKKRNKCNVLYSTTAIKAVMMYL